MAGVVALGRWPLLPSPTPSRRGGRRRRERLGELAMATTYAATLTAAAARRSADVTCSRPWSWPSCWCRRWRPRCAAWSRCPAGPGGGRDPVQPLPVRPGERSRGSASPPRCRSSRCLGARGRAVGTVFISGPSRWRRLSALAIAATHRTRRRRHYRRHRGVGADPLAARARASRAGDRRPRHHHRAVGMGRGGAAGSRTGARGSAVAADPARAARGATGRCSRSPSTIPTVRSTGQRRGRPRQRAQSKISLSQLSFFFLRYGCWYAASA